VRKTVIVFLFLLVVPIAASAVKYLFGDRSVDWQSADRSSAGLLPSSAAHPEALVRVYAARTVRWRGIFAVHSWIVTKEPNAASYMRYDYTAWGEPIRINGFAPDGRWFGDVPVTIAAADGEAADRMIPKIRAAVEGYQLRSYGDYRAWPGPNSNTFVSAVLSAVPELQAALPPTAIGKDFPTNGAVFGWTPKASRSIFSARCSASICGGRPSNCPAWGAWGSALDGVAVGRSRLAIRHRPRNLRALKS
jgi:hypothetical protein